MTIEIIQKEEKEMICDWCKNKYEIEAVHIEFWYGSKFDENYSNFCSDKCARKWVIKNLTSN